MSVESANYNGDIIYLARIQPVYSYYTPSVVPLHGASQKCIRRSKHAKRASSCAHLTSPTTKGTAPVYGNSHVYRPTGNAYAASGWWSRGCT